MDDMRDEEAVYEEELELVAFLRWGLRWGWLLTVALALVLLHIGGEGLLDTVQAIANISWVALLFPLAPVMILTFVHWPVPLRLKVDATGVNIRHSRFFPSGRSVPFSNIADVTIAENSIFNMSGKYDPIFTKSIQYGMTSTHKVTLHCRDGWRIHVPTNRPKDFLAALLEGIERASA